MAVRQYEERRHHWTTIAPPGHASAVFAPVAPIERPIVFKEYDAYDDPSLLTKLCKFIYSLAICCSAPFISIRCLACLREGMNVGRNDLERGHP